MTDRQSRRLYIFAFRKGDLRYYDEIPLGVDLAPQEKRLRIGTKIPRGAPLGVWRDLVGGERGEVDLLDLGVVDIDLSFWRDADPENTFIGLAIAPNSDERRERPGEATKSQVFSRNLPSKQKALNKLRRQFRLAHARNQPTEHILREIKTLIGEIAGSEIYDPVDFSEAVEVRPGYFVLDMT